MKRTIIISLLIYLILISSCSIFDRDKDKEDIIKNVINSVEIDSLKKYVQELSGEIPVSIWGNIEYITSRSYLEEGNAKAGHYLYTKLSDYNLQVSSQYNGTIRNIIGKQIGTKYPEQYYIICAHYDSYPDSSIAPGADDNASGTATVLEAARILSKYESDYTILYILWDEEEHGVRGSAYYAYLANNSGENILGVINIDMIGWDSDDDRTILINTETDPNSIPISDTALDIVDKYSLDLNPVIVLPGSGSDNLPFWYFGFSAIGIEEHWEIDWNDYYHTTEDKLNKFNIPYFHEAAKMAIGTIAILASIY